MGLIISALQERRNKKKVAKANAAKRRAREAAAEAEEGSAPTTLARAGEERRNKKKVARANAAKRRAREAAAGAEEGSASRGESTLARAGEERRNKKKVAKANAAKRRAREAAAEAEEGSAPRGESTLARAGEAQQVRNTEPGWRHIGRVPGAPDAAPTEGDPSSRPLQLPTEICEMIIDWMWDRTRMLKRCALVCKAWTPRCRYQMQRQVALWSRSHVQGHARRARAQPHLLQQARSVFVVGAAKRSERGPVPHLGTFAMMNAAKLPLVWRLDIQSAMWKPSDFHPLVFVHLSAFSSLTMLRLVDVTFPKVRDFGRLVCALPSLVRLRCENMLFTSTAPCASLAITRSPPSVRLTHLVIFSNKETASTVEANKSLVEHLCAMGVVAHLQRFEFSAWASDDSKYLDVYREPLHELFKQCSQSLRYLKLSPDARPDKDVEADEISDTIASVFNLVHLGSLEIVALEALNFERVGYAWMLRILESNVSKNLREVSIVMDRPMYSENAEVNLQVTVFALWKDMYRRLNKLFSNKDYEKLHHVDFVFLTHPDQSIPDATRWSTLLKAMMPKLDERGVLRHPGWQVKFTFTKAMWPSTIRLDCVLGLYAWRIMIKTKKRLRSTAPAMEEEHGRIVSAIYVKDAPAGNATWYDDGHRHVRTRRRCLTAPRRLSTRYCTRAPSSPNTLARRRKICFLHGSADYRVSHKSALLPSEPLNIPHRFLWRASLAIEECVPSLCDYAENATNGSAR
ncbi:hypothetical protein WOLCODRAFT_149683 [Wolfiporia cocos MD-104 SS10]|uniref:F-box domain-containing protein n=1 Tax=Wolfiporia cocos (strain MD-104) TaxID=742152 RepID=A0A2H3JFX9_WOLCO|nr:hypothetical protein WOLCODRAFT_149683 [Wolfiporia cocos MD-104 SS10]